MRTVEWDYENNLFQMIDQRLLPEKFEVAVFNNYHQVAKAITDMVVRGAPAIGAAAAFGFALAVQNIKIDDNESLNNRLQSAGDTLRAARPTAVNLGWAIDRMELAVRNFDGDFHDLKDYVLKEAQNIADQDVEINKRMAMHGETLIEDGDTVIHHCNTGSLATVDWGTALGVIRMAHELGKNIHVLVDETRPRLQGARLTAWELKNYQVPFDIISDNAAGYFLSHNKVQKVLFGADRVAANGDVANKIGTYMLALAAKDNNIPAYSVVPTSTIDLSLSNGTLIPIEERGDEEVLDLTLMGRKTSPEGVSARNPAFDITPNRLISGIVTEFGIARPPYIQSLKNMVEQSRQSSTGCSTRN